ncbi:2372_t:CDS:1, partial [Gigaspora margarita]
MQDTTSQPFLNGMLIHSQNNNNSTLPTVSAVLNLDDTKRTSLIKSSTDDISLSKTIESNSRISFNSNIQNTSMIPENSSNNESLLDDATIGYILNMLDTIGLDQNQESELQSSKLDSGYAKVSDEKFFTSDENSQDLIVDNDNKPYTLRRSKSSLSRKRSIRQKSLDNALSRTSTMNKNSFSEISEENLKESAGTDTTNHSLNSTKRAKS